MKKSIDWATVLREHELKATPLRIKLLNTLQATPIPFSVDELSRKLRGTDKVTLYRALACFEELKLIQSIPLKEGARYQLATTHLHHLVCKTCGKIEAIALCSPEIEKRALRKAKKFKSISSHSLEFFGTCKKCA